MKRAALFLIVACSAAYARDRGEIAGLIQDASGAAIVGVGITLMDQDSGVRRTGRTDGEGAYALTGLPPGEYKLTVRKPGFQTIIRWGIQIAAMQNVRLDFVMPVGSIQTVIEIRGGPSPVNTNDASVGTVVGREATESLPTNGRGVLGLVDLSPGVVITPAASGEAGQFSANGLRSNTNYFIVDGISANTSITGAGAPAQFAGAALPATTAYGSTDNVATTDDLDEACVLTSSFAPQFGRLPGAQVGITTRSGAEDIHVSSDYTLRNEAFDANDAFAQGYGLARAPLRLNQWGATLGGPLIRHRTFFFASYAGLRLLAPFTSAMATPSLSARQAAPANYRPALKAFPSPSIALPDENVAERVATFSRPARLDTASLRIDHSLTDRIGIFGRYNWAPSHTATGFNEIETFRLRTSSFTAGIDAAPTPTATNETRINLWASSATSAWNQNPASGGSPVDFGAILPSTEATVPNFYGLSVGGIGAIYAGSAAASRQGQLNLVDTLSVLRGPHTLRFGIDYQRLTPTRTTPSESVTGWWPNLAAILSGQSPVTSITSADEASTLVENVAFFAQDTWHISPRLTITYGLRWEITPPPSVSEPAAAASASPVTAAPVPIGVPVAPITQALWQTNYGQFAPRIGAAFRLDTHSVLRAGWGLFYDTGFSVALDPINGFPFNRWQFGLGTAASTSAPGYGLRTAPNLRLPYAAEWNVSWERMLGLRNIVSAAYVGSTGLRLLRYEGIPEPETNLVEAASATNDGHSNYHALELQYRRRLAPSLQGIAAYTWSHSIDNGSYDSGIYLAPQSLAPWNDRGNSSFDVRHNFTAGFTYAGRKHWELSAMLRTRTGFPIDLQNTEAFLGLGFDDIGRPNLIAGQPIWLPASVLGGRRLNPAAFSEPSGIEGNLGRNAIEGFGMSQLDLSVERQIPVHDRAELRLRLEAYNALNHPESAAPTRFLDSPFFGEPASMLNLMLGSGTSRSGLVPTYQAGGPRSLQMVLAVRF